MDQRTVNTPGAMMTTSIPKGLSSRRKPSDMALSPALLAEYADCASDTTTFQTQSSIIQQHASAKLQGLTNAGGDYTAGICEGAHAISMT